MRLYRKSGGRGGFRRLLPPLRVGVWNNFVKGVSERQHEPDQGRQLERAAREPESQRAREEPYSGTEPSEDCNENDDL